jgi:putative selenium metabolism protein SsnA
MSVALTGGRVVTSLDPVVLVDADVMVEDGRVTAVGSAPEAVARRDCSGCVIVPGSVCAHTHVYSALARGMPYALDPPANFLQTLQRVWWRLDRALDPDAIRASALVAAGTALLAGTTTLVDHHASPNAIDGSLDLLADAFEQVGIRSVLSYEVTDRDGPERARAGLEENRRFAWAAGDRPLARAMVGAHASFTLSPNTLDGCVEAARQAGVGIHVHVAEDGVDQRNATTQHGRRVVERLADAGALGPDDLLGHCVYLDEAELDLVRESGAAVAHNARSNMNNGVGRSPVGELGAHVALGTDGIDQDLLAESRAAFFRRREEDLSTGPGWALGRLAEGASLAGRSFGEPLLGRIEAGAPADLVVLEYEPPTPLSGENLGGHWMFGLSTRHVRDVLVAGRTVVQDRRLTGVDQEKESRWCAEQATRLWERLEDIGPHPFTPAGA